MDPSGSLAELHRTGTGFAAPVSDGTGVGFHEDALVTPASVMKIQVALTVETALSEGRLVGTTQVVMSPARMAPGPVGISLMRDQVPMSVRDRVVAMLTITPRP